MPVLAEKRLSPEEFQTRYAGEKPYWEYWNGEAFQKSPATTLHGLIQMALVLRLDELGLESAPEVTLKLDPLYELIPDVIALDGPPEHPYPTKPFELAAEILSPEDSFSRILRKCRLYEQWGIGRILVVDPAARIVWSFENGVPTETDLIATRGDRTLSAQTLWEQVDRRSSTKPAQ